LVLRNSKKERAGGEMLYAKCQTNKQLEKQKGRSRSSSLFELQPE
jgi:hypothetical protein